MPFISTNTWVLKIIDGTLSHRMKALGGYALYDEAFARGRLRRRCKHAQFLKRIKDASAPTAEPGVGGR